MKRNNKGFTLIEMLVSLAILAIVGASVAGFMSISSKNYVSVNKEVGIQYESQISINQLKDLIIDANKGISYGLDPVSGGFQVVDVKNQNSETELLAVLHANPANVDKVKRCLLIYNEKLKDDGSYEYPVVKIVWDPAMQQIYYMDKTYSNLTDLEADQYLQSIPPADYKLLAENVANFSVDLFRLKNFEVDLKVTYHNQDKKYETTPTIALRNKVVVGDNLRNLYQDNSVSKPNLALRVIIYKNGIPTTADTLLVGTAADYTAAVEMQFGAAPDNAVTWSLEGSSRPANETWVDQSGRVTISPDEESKTLILKATSAKLIGQPGILTITVEKIDKTKGYVQSVTLGKETITTIEGGETTGIYKMGYLYEFKDEAPYILYVNETKVTQAQRGVNWTVSTTAPVDSYSFSKTNGELIVNSKANGHTFTITATAKLPKPRTTNVYASDSKTIRVENLKEKPIPPDVEIVGDQDISRNASNQVTADIKGFLEPSYQWSIVGWSGNFGPANEHDGSWTDDKLLRSNVTLSNAKSKSPTITVRERLDWDQDFWIDLKVVVTEKQGDNKGKTVTKTARYTLGAVTAELVPQDELVMGYGDAERSVKLELSNFDNYADGIAYRVTTYRDLWGGTEKVGFTITSGSYTEDVTCNYDKATEQLKIKLSQNGRRILSKEIPWYQQWDSMKVEILYTNAYSGTGYTITLPVTYTFEYEE